MSCGTTQMETDKNATVNMHASVHCSDTEDAHNLEYG